MNDQGWRTLSSRLGWLVALTFAVGMALFALKLFHVIVPEPEFLGPDASFVDNLIASFEHQQDHWIENIGSSLLLAVGFVGIAVLGSALRQLLGREAARGAILAVTFLLAGALGAATQVLYLGAAEVTTNPEYCDCGFLAEEIVSRSMIDQVVGSVIFWMTDAATMLFAIGLLAFAAVAAGSGWVPEGLALYARVVAILGVLTVLWDRIVLPALDTGATDVDYGLIAGVVTIVFAGILIPIWAIWLATAARASEEPTAEPVT